MRRIEVASYNERGSFIQKEGWKTVVRWSARHRCIAKFFSSEEAGGEVGFCDPTLSHPRGRCSKRAKPTERRIVLWRSYSVFISLFFGYTSRRALASSQPIMRSHDNADKYLKKKRGEKKENVDLAHSRSTTPPPPPLRLRPFPSTWHSSSQAQIKRRPPRETALFSRLRFVKTNGIVVDDFVSSCNFDTA